MKGVVNPSTEVYYTMQYPSCSAPHCILQSSSALGYTGLILELEFEVMGLNLVVGFVGTFLRDFCRQVYI